MIPQKIKQMLEKVDKYEQKQEIEKALKTLDEIDAQFIIKNPEDQNLIFSQKKRYARKQHQKE